MAAFWVCFLLVIIAGYVIAFTRKGSVASASLGSRRKEFVVPADIETAFRSISSMRGKFTVDDRDPATKVIVLSSPVTLFTWGFLFPVFLHAEGTGTRVVVGCHSKFFQIGPLVTKSHDACEAAIKAEFALPPAYVA